MSSNVSKKTVSIYIDQQAAENALERLQVKADGFNKKIDDTRKKQELLNEKIAKLDAAGKSTTELQKKYDNLSKSTQNYTTNLESNAKQQLKITEQMEKGLLPSLAQQRDLVRKLSSELDRLGQSDPNFAGKAANFQKQNEQLQKMQANVRGVTEKINEQTTGFERILTRVAEYTIAFFAFEKIKDFLAGTIKEADHAKESIDSLKLALDNAGRSDLFELFNGQVEEFANKFKRLDNDDIRNIFTKLVDYGKLSANQIKDLTPVIINYAAKQKISLTDATDIFTKALEGNGKSLKTYGVNLTGTTTVSERFGIVIQTVGEKVKGAEAVLEETNKGAWEVFEQTIRNIQETIGTFIESLTGLENQSFNNAIAAKNEADGAETLLKRYEELSKKTHQTASEKKELQTITASLVGTFGDSIIEINKETGALQLNTAATQDLINQKLLLANDAAATAAAKYNKALTDQSKGAQELNTNLSAYNTLVEKYGKTAQDVTKSTVSFNRATEDLNIDDSKLTKSDKQLQKLNDSINQNSDKVQKASKDIEIYAKQLEDLGFKVTDVDKLFHPQSHTAAINPGGDPNGNTAELLKAAEAFNKKFRDLQNGSFVAGETQDQKEIDNVKHKYDEFLIEFKDFQQKLKGSKISLSFNEDDIKKLENGEIFSTLQKQMRKLFDSTKKDFDDANEKQYSIALVQSEKYFSELKQQEAEKLINGEEDEATYQKNIISLNEQGKAQLIVIAKNYLAFSKKASEDLTNFQKNELDQQTKDAIAAFEKSIANRKQIDQLQQQTELQHAQTLVKLAEKGGEEELLLKKNLLEKEREIKLKILEKERQDELDKVANDADRIKKRLDINNAINQQIADANATFDDAEDELGKQHILGLVNLYAGYFKQALDIASKVSQVLANIENAALNKELKSNDLKKQGLKRLLDQKLISQQQYQQRIDAIDKEADQKKQELERKQFERNKKIQIAQALLNGAMGVTAVLAARPGATDIISLGLFRAINIAATIATTLAEVAVIASSKYALGGKTKGPSHEQNGIAMIDSQTGRKVGELEGDEGVLKKSAMASKNKYSVTGTPSEIASTLNNMYGGVKWDSTAIVRPGYQTRTYQPVNYGRINKSYSNLRFAEGGRIPVTANNNAAPANNTSDPALLDTLKLVHDALRSIAQIQSKVEFRLSNPVPPEIPLKKITDAQNLQARIEKDATFR